MDGELPLVLYGGPGDLGVLRPARQRLSLVAVRRTELQHGAREVPVGQNLRIGTTTVIGGRKGGSARATYPE